MNVNNCLKNDFKELYKRILDHNILEIEKLLDKKEVQLPECFMRVAEKTEVSTIVDLVLNHWMVHGGFDEDFQSPLMKMTKKGHMMAAENVAYMLTKQDEHDFTDMDKHGMTVLDWAEVMEAESLRSYLEECLDKLRAAP